MITCPDCGSEDWRFVGLSGTCECIACGAAFRYTEGMDPGSVRGGAGADGTAGDAVTEREPPPTHRCRVCGHETRIETPSGRCENWCRGECDGFAVFERIRP